MKSFIRRFIVLSVSLMSLGAVLASDPLPAQAATSITVGDDGASCHGTVSTIQAAVTAIGTNPGKITICAGIYNEVVTIANANKLTITGKPNSAIRPSGGFTGNLIAVTNSANVTIQGLLFNGQTTLGTSAPAIGILFSNSTGTITKNQFVNWHSTGYATGSAYTSAIYISGGSGGAVKITKNTISDFMTHGIVVNGDTKATITGNTISGYGTVTNMPVGITVFGAVHGGTISKNTLTSARYTNFYYQAAIAVFSSLKVKVSSNTITHWYIGIHLGSEGTSATGGNDNKVTGNKVNDTTLGIYLMASDWGTYEAHADRNSITGNKVNNGGFATGEGGIIASGGNPAGGFDSFILNAVVKSNTVTNFTDGVLADEGGGTVITGVFAPNTIH